MKHIHTPIERHTVPRDYTREYYTSTLRPTEQGRIEYCNERAARANATGQGTASKNSSKLKTHGTENNNNTRNSLR